MHREVPYLPGIPGDRDACGSDGIAPDPRQSSASRARSAYPILIVDDHDLFSTSLMMLLRQNSFEALKLRPSQTADFLTRSSGLPVGLVVLDLDLGVDANNRPLNGAHLVSDLRKIGWDVLVVSGSQDGPALAAAIAEGAAGAVSKSCDFDALLRTIIMVADGKSLMTDAERRTWVSRHNEFEARDSELAMRLARLTTREREVLEMLAEGHRAAAIAESFVVSMTTIRTQIRFILAKLGVGGQLEAAALLRQSQYSSAFESRPSRLST